MAIEETPIQNPDLVRAMNLFMLSKTEQNGMKVSAELNKATFLVPIFLPEGTPDGDLAETIKNTVIQYLMLDQPNTDKSFLMAFTDQGELEKWNPDGCPCVFCPFSDIQGIVLKHAAQCSGVVINPFSQSMAFTAKSLDLSKPL